MQVQNSHPKKICKKNLFGDSGYSNKSIFAHRHCEAPRVLMNWLPRVAKRAGELLQRVGQDPSFPRGCLEPSWGSFWGAQHCWGLCSLRCSAGPGCRSWPQLGDAGGDFSR